jgi:hypothetical protein
LALIYLHRLRLLYAIRILGLGRIMREPILPTYSLIAGQGLVDDDELLNPLYTMQPLDFF